MSGRWLGGTEDAGKLARCVQLVDLMRAIESDIILRANFVGDNTIEPS